MFHASINKSIVTNGSASDSYVKQVNDSTDGGSASHISSILTPRRSILKDGMFAFNDVVRKMANKLNEDEHEKEEKPKVPAFDQIDEKMELEFGKAVNDGWFNQKKPDVKTMLDSDNCPNMFKSTRERYLTMDKLEVSDADITLLRQAWPKHYARDLTKPRDDVVCEPLESQYSTVKPLYRFLQHTDENWTELKQDANKLSIHQKMLDLLRDKMTGFDEKIQEMHDEYAQIENEGFHQRKDAGKLWQKTAIQLSDSSVYLAEDDRIGSSLKDDFKVYYQQDMVNYAFVPYGKDIFAIKTAFDFKLGQHQISFYKAEQGDDGPKFLEPIGDESYLVRKTEDGVKNFLTCSLVSYKIIGCRVYFFSMRKELEDGVVNRQQPDANGKLDDDRGIYNDNLSWTLTLNCFNLVKACLHEVRQYSFECTPNYEGDEYTDNDYFEVLSAFFVNPLGQQRVIDERLISDEQADDELLKDDKQLIVVFEGIVTPEKVTDTDHLKAAKFHVGSFKSLESDSNRYTVEMDLKEHFLDLDDNESCINLMNPLKVFQVDDAEVIESLRAQIVEKESDNPFPSKLESLIFICAFNDGTKGPQEDAQDTHLLPDVFAVVTKSQGNKYDQLDLPQHRCIESESQYDKSRMRMHKKLNKALQYLACRNFSAETYRDRLDGCTKTTERSLCRSEAECFKMLANSPKEGTAHFSIYDKLYLGKGKWAKEQRAIMSSATYTDKTKNRLTIMLYIAQDRDQHNVRIWNIKMNQWNNQFDEPSLRFEGNISKILKKIMIESQNKQNRFHMKYPVTVSRHCPDACRYDDQIFFFKEGKLVHFKDHDFQFQQLGGSQVFRSGHQAMLSDEEILQMVDDQKTYSLYLQEAERLLYIRMVPKGSKQVLTKEITKIEFPDDITRRKIQPMQLTIAEDDRDHVACLVYNSNGVKLTLEDAAFVIFEASESEGIKLVSFIDLQFGTQKIFKKEKQNTSSNQLMLTMSSEIEEGKRPLLSRDGRETDSVELYYTQRYQAAFVDPYKSIVQIVEIAVKYIMGRDGVERVESSAAGVKKVIFNRPGQFDAVFYPLFEKVSDDEGTSLKIVGSQLFLLEPNLHMEGSGFCKLRKVLDYNFRNPSQSDLHDENFFTSRNEFTYSRLHEIVDGNRAVIAETWLKAELVQMNRILAYERKLWQMASLPVIEDFEFLRLLNNANSVTLNMTLLEMHEFINNKSFLPELNGGTMRARSYFEGNICKMFTAMQLYNGHSKLELISDHRTIEELITGVGLGHHKMLLDHDYFVDQFSLNPLQRVIRSLGKHTVVKNLVQFEKADLLVCKNVVRFNINMMSLMQVRLVQHNDKISTISLVNYLQERQSDMTSKYMQIMSTLPTVLEQEWASEDFMQMFSDLQTQTQDDEKYEEASKKDTTGSNQNDSDGEEDDQCQQVYQPVRFRLPLKSSICNHIQLTTQGRESHYIFRYAFNSATKSLNYYDEKAQHSYAKRVKEDKQVVTGNKYVLNYSVIILRDYALSEKLLKLTEARESHDVVEVSLEKFSRQELANLVKRVIEVDSDEIEESSILRDLINSSFLDTFDLNIKIATAYIFLHMIPTYFLIFYVRNPVGVYVCCGCSLLMQLILFSFEYMDMAMRKGGFCEYINDFWNCVDFISFLLNVTSCIVRLFWNGSYLPKEEYIEEDMKLEGIDYQMKLIMPFFNFIILVLTFIQLLFYLRFNAGYGALVELTVICFRRIAKFTGFLILWILFYAGAFNMLGATFDEDQFAPDYNGDLNDYPKVPLLITFLFQSFRNSIADLGTPHYKYWETRWTKGDKKFSQFAILFIWAVWISQVYLMCIMLTNFLIAIVSQVFEQVQSEKMQTEYFMKADLNCEEVRYHNFVYQKNNRDYIVLAVSQEASVKSKNEWQGLVKQIRKNFNARFNDISKTQQSQHDDLAKRVSGIEDSQEKIMKMLNIMNEKLVDMTARRKKAASGGTGSGKNSFIRAATIRNNQMETIEERSERANSIVSDSYNY